MRNLPSLTGFRGLAALYVVFYHVFNAYNAWGPAKAPAALNFTVAYGWLGVDLFFVLSGFLLARPFLSRNQSLLAPRAWFDFLKKRWMRIAPPYYAAIVFSLLLIGSLSYLWQQPDKTLLHLVYLPTASSKMLMDVNPVFWSLAVEFQFYIVLPLLLFALVKWPKTAITGLLVTGLLWWALLIQPGAEWHNFWVASQLPAYLFHFGLGILAARLELGGWRTTINTGVAAFAAIVFLIAIPVLLARPPTGTWAPLEERTGYMVMRSLPAIGFAILVFLGATASGWATRLLETQPMQHLGKTSYSLYLVHLPVIVLLAKQAPWTMEFGYAGFLLFALPASWVATMLLHLAIEKPSLEWKDRSQRKPVPASTPSPAPSPSLAVPTPPSSSAAAE